MSDEDKGFLSRWSQRKQEAKQPEPIPAPPAAEPAQAPPQAAEAASQAEFDLSSLPKLEDITGSTDISAFLKKGVPEGLRNAVLRKSWALDPAIRNYVNPALDYAYDWNTPGGVPGNGEIGAGFDIARQVLQIMGGGGSAAEASALAAETEKPQAEVSARSDEAQAKQDSRPESKPDLPTQPLRLVPERILTAERPSDPEKAASCESEHRTESQKASAAPQQPVRRHGSAKPFD